MPLFNNLITYLKTFYLLGFSLTFRSVEPFQVLFSEAQTNSSFFRNIRWHLLWLILPVLWLIKFVGYGLPMFLLASVLGNEWFVGTAFFQGNSILYSGYASAGLFMQTLGYLSLTVLASMLIASATLLVFVMGFAWVERWVLTRYNPISYTLICNFLTLAGFIGLVVSEIVSLPFLWLLNLISAESALATSIPFLIGLVSVILSSYWMIRIYIALGAQVGISAWRSAWVMILSGMLKFCIFFSFLCLITLIALVVFWDHLMAIFV